MGYARGMGFRGFVLLSIMATTALFASSCSSSSSNTPSSSDATTVTQSIGPAGGVIEVSGAVVTFPKDSVTADTKVTISIDPNVPDGFVALSKVFKCEPSGTTFLAPVEMRMPFIDDGKGGTLFWSSGTDPAFKDLGGRVDGKTVVATVQHFSSGFVGRKK